MARILYFTISFLISTVLFVLFNSSGVIDTIIFLIFIISALILVFSREELPKAKELLEIPEVHSYQKSRVNIYGYLMAGLLILVAILYSVLTVYLNLRTGIASLILWLLMIIASYVITKTTSEKTEIDKVIDFVKLKTDDLNLEKELQIEKLVRYIFSNRKAKELDKKLNMFSKKEKISKKFKDFVLQQYNSYYSALETKVTSDEIKALNEELK